eukprot:2715396-Pleurochrysis_carterae.AAC.1
MSPGHACVCTRRQAGVVTRLPDGSTRRTVGTRTALGVPLPMDSRCAARHMEPLRAIVDQAGTSSTCRRPFPRSTRTCPSPRNMHLPLPTQYAPKPAHAIPDPAHAARTQGCASRILTLDTFTR